MAFGSENDIKIKIEVDNSGAVRVLDSTGKKIEEFGDKAQRTSQKVEGFGSKLAALRASATVALGALSAAAAALTALGAAAVKGSSIAKVEESFVRLTDQAGVLAYDVLVDLQNATDGTISSLELMKRANEALTSGIKPDQLVKLAQAADAVADATGGDATATLDKYINAFQKGNAAFVAGELGLSNYSEVLKGVLDDLGVEEERLTESARKLIERNILIYAAEGATAKLGTTTDTAGKIIEQWGTEIANSTNNLLVAITTSESLATTLNVVEKSVIGVADALIGAQAQLKGFAQAYLQFIEPLTSLNPISGFLNQTAQGALAGPQAAAVQGPQIPGNIRAERLEQERANDELERSKKLREAISAALKEGGRVHSRYLKELEKEEPALKALHDEMVKVYEANKKLTSFDGIQGTINAVEDLTRALQDGTITAGQFEKFFGEIVGDLSFAGVPSEEAGREIAEGAARGLESSKKTLDDTFSEIMDGAAMAAADAISSLINGGNGREALAGLTTDIFSTIGQSLGGDLGGAVGKIIGELVGKLIKGSETAAEKARKSLDKALGDILRNNPAIVVIDDVQKAIDDLDVTPAQEEIDRFSESLDNISSNSINAAAVALEQLSEELGVEVEEIRGLLYNALVANLGGSILNLRSLLAALGKDANDLSGALFDAFAAGAISAAELIRLLQGVQTLFSPGIPNAVGAVGEAFEQFQALAEKGGTAAIEAVRATAVEALEAGASTFEELGNILVNQYGFNAEYVAQLFEALRAAGVNTLEDLAKATEDTGVAILANFQNIMAGIAQMITGEQVAALRPNVGGGGGGGLASAAEQAAEATLNAVAATDEYRVALDSLNAGLITNRDLQKILNSLSKEYTTLSKQRENVESRITEILERGGKATAQQWKELDRLNRELEEFGKIGTEGFREVNKGLIRFYDTFKENTNLLGLAAEAAGLSFEQLKQPIVDAFRAGKISAKEALEELKKYQQGLGNAGDSAADALTNFLTGGTSGGAFTLDAFKDIFAEAIKDGGKGLIDLEAQLLAQGVDSGRISKLFDAIRSSGIESLDQLASASDEAIIGIIGKAEELGLPFAQTNSEIKSLLAQLEKIRNSGPVKVKLTADMDPTLLELLDLINGRRRGRRGGQGVGNTSRPNA